MKKLTIAYFLVALILTVLVSLFLQLKIAANFTYILVPFLVFLFVYGVLVLFNVIKNEKKQEALNQQIESNIEKTNEWKSLAKDAHHNEVNELENKISELQQAHDQEIDFFKTTHEKEISELQQAHNQEVTSLKTSHEKDISDLQQAHYHEVNELKNRISELQQAHNQEIKSIITTHEKEKSTIIEEKRQAMLTLIEQREEILPYKFLVDGCAVSFGADQHGLLKRLNEAEALLSNSVDTMSGITYERYVGYRLKVKGWTNIEYTKASGDKGVDILGIDTEGYRSCVQCKRYDQSNPIGIKAVQEAYYGKAIYDCERAYLCANHEVTQEARISAQKTDVTILMIN